MAKTLSFGKGKGNINHNNREYETENVDHERVKDNIIYAREPLEEAYKKCFGKTVWKYNMVQKRADRKKSVTGYMDEIKRNQSNRNGEKLFYETVVGIGDMYDTGIETAPKDAKVCAEVLDKYMKSWRERNPNLYVFNAVLHMDEKTPHLHIDYIPVGTGYKRGLSARNSLTRAFENMGLKSQKTQKDNGTIAWQKRERDFITELSKERGIEIEYLGEKREDLTVAQYKAQAIGKREIRLTSELSNIKEERDKKFAETKQLKECADKLIDVHGKLEKENQQLKESNEFLAVKNNVLTRKCADLTEQSEVRSKTLDEINSKIKTKQEELDSLNEMIEIQDDYLQTVTDLCNDKSMELDETSMEIERISGEIDQKKGFLSSLDGLIFEYEQRLKTGFSEVVSLYNNAMGKIKALNEKVEGAYSFLSVAQKEKFAEKRDAINTLGRDSRSTIETAQTKKGTEKYTMEEWKKKMEQMRQTPEWQKRSEVTEEEQQYYRRNRGRER